MQGCKHLLEVFWGGGGVLLHSILGLQHVYPWGQHLCVTRVSIKGLSLRLCNLLQQRRDMAEGAHQVTSLPISNFPAFSSRLYFPAFFSLGSPSPQVAQLTDALKEAKAAEKEVRSDVAGVLREGRAAQQELAAAEAAAEKAVSGSTQ